MNHRSIAFALLIAGVVTAFAFPLALWAETESLPDAKASAPLTETLARRAYITPQARRSIDRGTKWLLTVMRPNGMVGADYGMPPDLSCTAITGLALLSQGNTPLGGKHAKELRQIIDATLILIDSRPSPSNERRGRTLVQSKIGYHADQFLAALFLSQVLGEAHDADEDVRRALEKLVVEISSAQRKDGTWGEDSWAPVLGTVLGWESLRASSSCGLHVDIEAHEAGEALLRQLEASMGKKQGWMHSFYKDAASIRVLYSMGFRNEPAFEECVRRTLEFARGDSRPFAQAGGEEYLAFFFVTECLLHERDEEWQEWYPLVSEKIIRQQNADGSWSGHHCITDRTFCTAAALLTIQATHYSLPISNL